MNKKQTELFQLIQNATLDFEVQKDPKLIELLEGFMKDLQRGIGPRMVSVKLSNAISCYLVLHHFKAPNALKVLFSRIEEKIKSREVMTSSYVLETSRRSKS